MIWATINITLTLFVVAIVVFKLTRLADTFSRIEMLGMALTAAALVMNIGPIVANGSVYGCPMGTPFDHWATSLLRLGLAIYFSGRMIRHFKHKWANDASRDQARRHLFGERKL